MPATAALAPAWKPHVETAIEASGVDPADGRSCDFVPSWKVDRQELFGGGKARTVSPYGRAKATLDTARGRSTSAISCSTLSIRYDVRCAHDRRAGRQ
jgi:hypothetical protein